MPAERVPITRHDADGTIIDGTAQCVVDRHGASYSDFRGLDGNPLGLPPQSSFSIPVDVPKGAHITGWWATTPEDRAPDAD